MRIRRRRRFGLVPYAVGLVLGLGLPLLGPRPANAQMATGTYLGDGTDNRLITGLGFKPDVVLIKGNDFDAAYTPTSAVMRTSTMVGDLSKPMVLDNALVANQIQYLNNDGFVIGSDRRVNQPGINFYWVAWKADADLKLGTYTGNGTSWSITGVGFKPDWLIVMSSAARRAVHTASVVPNTFGGPRSFEFDSAGWIANEITSLDLDGFSVTHNATKPYANENGVVYHYVAWHAAAGKTAIAKYQGNATDNRNFTGASGTGFKPEYVLSKAIYNNNVSPTFTPPPAHRFVSMGAGDRSINFSNGTFAADHFQAFLADGFQIGAALSINRLYTDCNVDGPGCEYFYLAFNQTYPDVPTPPLEASEGSSTLTVTALNSFEMTFDTATGGNLRSFYDLAEDPWKSYDLAGKPSANVNGLFHPSMMTIPGPTVYVTGTNNSGAKLDLLEATSTRVRVRQEAFYQAVPPSTTVLPGVKGIGDYSVYPKGVAVRWNRRTTTNTVSQTENSLEIAVRRENLPDPRDTLNSFSETSTTSPGPATDDFILAQREVSGVRTDFLAIMNVAGGDWAAADTLDWNNSSRYHAWRDQTPVLLPDRVNESWNFLVYYKPTSTFVLNTDGAVTSRRTDYRSPDVLTVTGPATGWFDTDENTASPSDFYNEAEAAYALNLDPVSGLTFDIDGAGATRYQPFFKIRQWRSFSPPATMTVDGVTKTRNVDYRADVKPVSGAHFAQDLLWHSTLDDAAAVTAPDVGGAGAVNGTTTFALARPGQGSGPLFDAANENISLPATSNFNKSQGTVEFWYQPRYNHTDNTLHVIWAHQFDANHYFQLEKMAGGGTANLLHFLIQNGAGPTKLTEVTVASTAYSWRAYDWVHLRVTWDTAAVLGDQVRIFVNGVEPAHADPSRAYDASTMSVGTIYIGNDASGTLPAMGIIDEFHIYDSANAPTARAHGGLVASAEEYLADSSKNFPLPFAVVDGAGTRRGEYFYVGSDSKFRGLNVYLATAGVGSVNLQWQYWNGTSWADLEAAGFADTTSNLTANGTLSWSDPTNCPQWPAQPCWVPCSVNGGPDLYYVRAYLASGAYTTSPTERQIKTDILLFQYNSDIVGATPQTFSFAAPLPTAVELMSFSAQGQDSAVSLSWQTGSELENLGFHLYRATAEGGPYTRITSSLIPGLGSSPVGASYSYLDSGLLNGTTYFYRLEDIETTGATKQHGPVQATPQASAPAPGDGGTGGDGGSGGGTDPGSGSGPGGASGGTDARLVYGDPSLNALSVRREGPNAAVVELITGGFYAVRQADGTLSVELPGFEDLESPGSPAVPSRRAWVEAVAGRGVALGGVRASEVSSWPGVRLSALGTPQMEVGGDGTVRAGLRPKRQGLAFRTRGLVPAQAARLVGVAFQGEVKKAELELSPLRWDPHSQSLLLARRLVVRVRFEGVEAVEKPVRGARGRRDRTGWLPTSRHEVLAQLVTRAAGIYAARYEDVFGSLVRGRPTRELVLSRQGESVAFHVEPNPSVFAPGSTLYFVSEGSSLNPYGRQAVYELASGTGGVQMTVVTAGSSGSPVSHYRALGRFEQNRAYLPGLLEAEDLWQWDAILSGKTKSYPFTLSALAGGASTLTVFLQGGTDFDADPDHHLRIWLNGSLAGETRFAGMRPHRLELSLSGVLQEGENTLEIENVADTAAPYSVVYLDKFALAYSRRPLAESGQLVGRFEESGLVEVAGLNGRAAVVETSGAVPRWLQGALPTPAGTSFSVEADKTYWAAEPLSAEVRLPRRTGLKQTTHSAQYLVVAPEAFLPEAQRLVDHRLAEGLLAKAVAIEDVWDEFGHGEAPPQALRSFLTYAYHHWSAPALRYVLLLGDATYDFKDNLRTGQANQVPPLLVKTSYLWTSSDPSYAAVNGEDSLPDLAIGRLPARTLEEARSLVDKTLAFESSGHDLKGRAVLVADNADAAGPFEANSDEIAALLGPREVDKIYLRDTGAADMRPAIAEAFDRGSSLMSYVGHGAVAIWASENVFNIKDVPDLAPQPQQPFLLTMNCLNGYFHAPGFNSLAEELVKADGKGAVGAFAPAGLSLDPPAHAYEQALVQELASGRHHRLGDAVLAAQSTYADTGAFPELLGIYHLLGDPALTIRKAVP